MANKPELRLIEGDRDALELEALLTFPKDFQKFLTIMQSLERRNVPLSVVPTSVQPDSAAEE